MSNSARRTYDVIRGSVHQGMLRLVEDELMASLSASRASVRTALQRLAGEGLVARSPRTGTSAVTMELLPVSAVTALSRPDRRLELRCLEARTVPAPALLRERLELPDGSPMALVEVLVLRDDEPIALLTGYVGLPSHGAGAEVVAADPLALLRACVDVHAGEGSTVVGARSADLEAAELLGVSEGAALLWCEDTVRDVDGRPRALCHWSMRSDRVALTTSIPATPA